MTEGSGIFDICHNPLDNIICLATFSKSDIDIFMIYGINFINLITQINQNDMIMLLLLINI